MKFLPDYDEGAVRMRFRRIPEPFPTATRSRTLSQAQARSHADTPRGAISVYRSSLRSYACFPLAPRADHALRAKLVKRIGCHPTREFTL